MASSTDCGFEILSHPPYSPDLAPLTSSGVKTTLRLGINEGVKEAVNEFFED
jgi:hypothetical protein